MAERVRHALSGPVSVLMVLVMLAGCLVLWIGVPLAWLWVGSQVQSSSSLGTAMLVTMAGIVPTIIAVVMLLAWLNRRHVALQERRSPELPPYSPLEIILVTSAGIAVVGFGIWFFGFAGASPAPLNIGF